MMNQSQKDDLYDQLDKIEEMSDSEKREAYLAEIQEQEYREKYESGEW